MDMLSFAKRELDLVGFTEDSEEMNLAMRNHILKMVEVFSGEGHSGYSAHVAADILFKLFNYLPLSPLTGEDSEWMDVSEHTSPGMFQNVRSPRVFKGDNGAFDVNGKVFVEPSGNSYTNSDSCVAIEFPYYPKTEYVEAPTPPDEVGNQGEGSKEG
jgi:hypothetical protein